MSSCSGTPQTPARRARVSLHVVLLQVRSSVLPPRVLGCCDQSGPWGRSVRPHQRVHCGGSVQYCLFFHGLQLPVSCSMPEVGVSAQPLGQGLQPGCVHTASCPCRSGHPRCPRRATRPPAGGRCTVPMLGARAALRRGHRSPRVSPAREVAVGTSLATKDHAPSLWHSRQSMYRACSFHIAEDLKAFFYFFSGPLYIMGLNNKERS